MTTPEGRVALLGQVGNNLRAKADDPVLGLNNAVEGAAFLRDYPRVEEAMRAAAQAKDGLRRAVRLGNGIDDGVALAGPRSVMLVAPDHLWANRLLRAITTDPSRMPLIRFEGGSIVHVDRSELTISPTYGERKLSLNEVMGISRGDVYVHERYRSALVFENGSFIPNTLPRDTRVIVREAVAANRQSVAGMYSQPDVRTHGGAEWFRIGANSSGSNASSGSTVAVPPSNGQILLVCPDTQEKLPGCEE